MSEERPIDARTLEGAEPELIDSASIDVHGCCRMELSVPLFEQEKAGLRFESWPQPVQVQMERQLEAWRSRRPDRAIVCITTAVQDRVCVMIFHHREKKQ
jgi:hypothetical protein